MSPYLTVRLTRRPQEQIKQGVESVQISIMGRWWGTEVRILAWLLLK